MQKTIVNNKLYIIGRARFNGVWIDDCLIPDKVYTKAKKYPVKKTSTPRRYLEIKLDDLWRKAVKIKWGFKCAVCGTDENLESHHIFPRGNKGVRWDLDFGICLCVFHHTLDNKSAHLSPEWFKGFLIELLGQNEYDRLSRKAKKVIWLSKQDLELLVYKLEGYIKSQG